MALSKASVKKIKFSGKKVYFSRILKQYFKTMAARDKAVAREKARRAREEAREARRRAFEESHPYVSEITRRRYKTEKGMQRAEERYLREHPPIDLGYGEEEEDGIFSYPPLILKAESRLPMDYTSLTTLRNRWSHGKSEDNEHILGRIFTDLQGDWTTLEKDTLKRYYDIYKDNPDIMGRTIFTFIREVMGIHEDD